MTKLFFYVSGEHKTLPYAEIKAILEAEGFLYENVETFPKLLCLKSDIRCVPSISRRAGFLKVCGVEIFRCRAEEKEIIYRAKAESYDEYIMNGQTFSVRVKKSQVSSVIDVRKLEREIGRTILERAKDVKVRLNSPDKAFLGVLSGGLLIFGLELAEASSKDLFRRKPRRRPFFHPSAMSPKLARCMVNLARTKPNSLVLDPFCGTGSILLETGLIGCGILGSDINPKMVRGSLQNLKHFKIHPSNFLVADAKNLPFRQVDCIVTDPPYGRASSTFGGNIRTIVAEFLHSAVNTLKECGHICISLPSSVKIREVCEGLGYKIVEEHSIREHKSLTREITILKFE